MNQESHFIIVPGLGDRVTLVEELFQNRFPNLVKIHVYRAPWIRNEESLSLKMKRFLMFIDQLTEDNGQVSLGGISAGGSFVLNAYMERKSKVNKVVNICGRLRVGEGVFPSLNLAAIRSRAFYDSVCASEQNLKKLTVSDKKNFMTMSAWFDEQVPHQTSVLDGAINLTIPMAGHIFSQAYALCFMNRKITNFITS